jgi:two-component system cell cycle response regulator DivK
MSGKRILYIEDNSDNRLLIKRVLEAEGYIVVEAETGLKGLELAASSQPDLILMDINLPEIDGYECTHRLRKISGGEKIPIIALTANAMEGDAQKALDAGCNGYIPKPIDVDHLPTQIEKYLMKPEAEISRPVAIQPQRPQPLESPSAGSSAPNTPTLSAPAPSAPIPSAPTPSTSASSVPAPSTPELSAPAPSTPSTSTPAPSSPSSGAPASSTPAVSPSPQSSDSQGQSSQAQNVQTPNPQSRGSQN